MSLFRLSLITLILFCFQISYSQNDCSNALVACGNSSYNNITVTGPGAEEINSSNSCQGQENNTLWIKVNIKTAGTLAFTLTPGNTSINVDFDFYIFGPTASCGNLGNSIRCSSTNPQAAGSSSNTTGMRDSESDTSEGPGSSGNNYVQSLNTSEGDVYYIVIDRFEGNSDFSIEWTGTATFNEPPTVNNNTNIAGATLNQESCDIDGVLDNRTTFNLTQTSTLAIGSQININASFHTSENDAITGINPIINPITYTNISTSQAIFLRLQNSITGCFSTARFTITVIPFVAPDPNNIEECDIDNDGFVAFNLSNNTVILANGDPNIAISYHPTASDLITLPNIYTNANPFINEVVWVKIRNTISGCFVYKSFNIIINRIPIAIPSQLTQCDFEVFPDGLTRFNLDEAKSVITNNIPNLSISYYLNLTDAQNNTNALTETYNNTTNPQTLSARVTDNTTGCFSLTSLTLNVNTNATITAPLYECDDDGTEDGVASFNFANAGFETAGNTVNYYLTVEDALLEQNAITNRNFSNQVIYARVENANSCIGIHIINLEVLPIPSFTIENNEILCLNNIPNQSVTLNTIVDNPLLYSYSWTPNGENTQTIEAFSPGNYTVTVTNILTSCSKTLATEIITSDIATIISPTIIDLEDNNTITVNITGNGIYVYSIDDEFGIYQESNTFTNVPAGLHIVYVKDLNGCGTSSKEINVLGVPTFFTPNGDGFHDFWNIKGVSESSNSNAAIYIFNRFGKLLKQINPLEQGWNGTFNGSLMPADDYWYNVQLEDGRIVKGNFTLKR